MIAALVFLLADGASAATPADLVHVLANQRSLDGCGWYASADSLGKDFVFLAELDESVAYMNIGGQDVRLHLGPDRGSMSDDFPGLGSRWSQVWIAADVHVEAAYIVTWVCPKESESCEVTKFDVTFSVQQKGATQVLQAKGAVGC